LKVIVFVRAGSLIGHFSESIKCAGVGCGVKI